MKIKSHLRSLPLTSSSLPPEASFAEREKTRQGHLLSTVVAFLMISLIILIPATIFIPNRLVLFAILIMLSLCSVALLINRSGWILLAGSTIVVSFEVALMLIIVTTKPFDVFNLPLFDFFIMTELLAVTLLPPRSVFVILFLNTVFQAVSLRFQPHTPLLTAVLQIQFYNALVRPVAIQFIVAVVSYLSVQSTRLAIKRADRAEAITMLEHTILQQKINVEQEKHLLEIGIKELVAIQMHAVQEKQVVTARFPEAKVLWPLVTAFNMLLARLKQSYHAEKELQALKQAIYQSAQYVDEAKRRNSPPSLSRSGTSLDMLILALARQPSSSPILPDSTLSDVVKKVHRDQNH